MAELVTTFATFVDGENIYSGDSFELAARAWDGATFSCPAPDGGISVKTFDGDVMVRDGWLLHISSGIVYVSPTLKIAS